jgi:hypothetical protein
MTTLDQEPKASPNAMNIAVKWGLISTAVSIILFVIRAAVTGNPFESDWIWTLLVTAVSIALIVLGQREFKNSGDGFMSYGQGFKIGFVMGLISVIVYGIFVLIYANFIDAELMDKMLLANREKMEAQGTPDEQIEMALGWTKKLFWPIFFVFGIFGSAIVTLIVTIFTQKNNPNPAV